MLAYEELLSPTNFDIISTRVCINTSTSLITDVSNGRLAVDNSDMTLTRCLTVVACKCAALLKGGVQAADHVPA